MVIKYPLMPWLAMMMLGWVFGRHIVRVAAGQSHVPPTTALWVGGGVGLFTFAVVRAAAIWRCNVHGDHAGRQDALHRPV